MGAEASRGAYAVEPDEGGEAAPTASQHPRAARLFVFQDDKWQLVGAEVCAGGRRASEQRSVSVEGDVRVT
jgi:hypothetical protein